MASERGLLTQGEALMESIKSRNDASHTYDSEAADEIFNAIVEDYHAAFQEIKTVFDDQLQQRRPQ